MIKFESGFFTDMSELDIFLNRGLNEFPNAEFNKEIVAYKAVQNPRGIFVTMRIFTIDKTEK